MYRPSPHVAGRTLVAVLALSALAANLIPSPAFADVSRIREKALELRQNLNQHLYRYLARAEKPATERVYKNFAFILKQSTVDEVAAETGDPHSEELRLFLVESIVNLDLAAFEDEQRAFMQSARAALDSEELDYVTLYKRLATAEDAADRRKIYSAMDPLFETVGIFGNEIMSRREAKYQPWGFDNYADFYAKREQLDLDALAALGAEFIVASQETYDQLLETITQTQLGIEARKLRFYDVPYLLQGNRFEHAFPAAQRSQRMADIYGGLGIPLGDNLLLDDRRRDGKAMQPGVFPTAVPGEVNVAVNPAGGVGDDLDLVFAVGLAQTFTQSTQTTFETAYLPNLGAQAALAYIPTFVMNEPQWLTKHANADHYDAAEYLNYRAFRLLYEARALAGKTQLEISAYRGGKELRDLQKEFRDTMKDATGARISSTDAKRNSEVLAGLRSASQFQGLLLAAGIRQNLVEAHGAQWFATPAAGSELLTLWKQGGDLQVDAVKTAFAKAAVDPAALMQFVTDLMSAAGEAVGEEE